MQKFTLVLILASIMAMGLAGSSDAVQLRQGWYATFDFVTLYTSVWNGDHEEEWLTGWYPTSALVSTGPVRVEESYPVYGFGRRVQIAENVDVGPGVLFEDSGAFAFSAPYYQQVRFSCETSYDAGRMQVQIWRTRTGGPAELLWSQTQSGHALGPGQINVPGNLLPGDGIAFRVTAVPEPPGLISLLFMTSILAVGVARRNRSCRE